MVLTIKITAKLKAMKLINLQGRRVLITQAGDFMGPALERVFAALGAVVVADPRPLGDDRSMAARVIEEAGVIDVLIAHLCCPRPPLRWVTWMTTSGDECLHTWWILCPD